MSRKGRAILSLGLTLAGSASAPFLMFGVNAWNWSEYLAIVLIGFILLLPAWLFLAPIVLFYSRIDALRGLIFALVGSVAAPSVLVSETIYFFDHARANAFPTHAWFVHEVELTTICSAVLCCVYLLIVGSAHARFSTNMQSAR